MSKEAEELVDALINLATRLSDEWCGKSDAETEGLDFNAIYKSQAAALIDAAFAKVREECADRLCGNCPSDGVPGMCKKGYCGWRKAILGTEVRS